MIRGFSVKNMVIAVLIGTLVATNFHIPGLSAGDIAAYIAIVSVAAWAAVEEMEIRYGKRCEKRTHKDRQSLHAVRAEEKLVGSKSRL